MISYEKCRLEQQEMYFFLLLMLNNGTLSALEQKSVTTYLERFEYDSFTRYVRKIISQGITKMSVQCVVSTHF